MCIADLANIYNKINKLFKLGQKHEEDDALTKSVDCFSQCLDMNGKHFGASI